MKSGLDLSFVRSDIRPQDDLYRHMNGGWLAEPHIPADRAAFGAFHQLVENAQHDLRAIIEEAAAGEAPHGSEAQQVGDLYKSFMDEERINELGLTPILSDLSAIDQISDVDDLIRVMGDLQASGVTGAFAPYVNTDDKKSDQYIVYLEQDGLGLPDEAYYRDDQYAAIREQYVLSLIHI